MIKLKDRTCTEFTELIASKAPAPGGGGASALVASIGISLGDMVGEFTVGKPKYAEYEDRLTEMMKRSQEIRIRLLELIDEDAENFIPLSKAYAIPKDEPGRDETIEECLKLAIKAPLEVFDLSKEALELLTEYSQKGSKIIISDAYTGLAMIKAAMEGAAINVRVNTKLMKDREYAERIEKHLSEQ